MVISCCLGAASCADVELGGVRWPRDRLGAGGLALKTMVFAFHEDGFAVCAFFCAGLAQYEVLETEVPCRATLGLAVAEWAKEGFDRFRFWLLGPVLWQAVV